MKDILTKINPEEKIWVQYLNEDKELTHIVTSNKLRTEYYLYEIQNGEPVKIQSAVSPAEFSDTISIERST